MGTKKCEQKETVNQYEPIPVNQYEIFTLDTALIATKKKLVFSIYIKYLYSRDKEKVAKAVLMI